MIRKILMLITVLAAVLAPLADAEETSAVKKVIVKVNGAPLTNFDLDDEISKIVPRSIFHRSMTDEKRLRFRPQAFTIMVESELLYQEAKRMGLKIDKKLIDEAQERVIKGIGGKKNFKAALKQRESSEKEYRSKIERNMLITLITENEIKNKAVVTEEEVAANYEENKKMYMRPEARRLWHVLISVEPAASPEVWERRMERAEDALKKARSGEDLSRLAWDYSDDPYRVKGGDIGLVHIGRLDKSVEDAAFKLNKGELSGIIESIYGFHIVKVLDIMEPQQLSLKDVSQKIRKSLSEKKLSSTREALISKLKAAAVIEVMPEEE